MAMKIRAIWRSHHLLRHRNNLLIATRKTKKSHRHRLLRRLRKLIIVLLNIGTRRPRRLRWQRRLLCLLWPPKLPRKPSKSSPVQDTMPGQLWQQQASRIPRGRHPRCRLLVVAKPIKAITATLTLALLPLWWRCRLPTTSVEIVGMVMVLMLMHTVAKMIARLQAEHHGSDEV
ncbi:uncharacterized protein LOC110430921 isoform X2 [Sorghum bicolor]|uniref:uncharacterized protein LOC110430921 isoform X2 n=1 Tax=Sorghum bicolor TaxID=4558 RepID=UPI000B425D47|nr:uncharacterized protein LOC110430921 isoform X2 [Sorghum bicolor]|eukprot:XP_021304821.1 uncharacterized protein LOC110430921 isoform X2 [Sorghum bicolor]